MRWFKRLKTHRECENLKQVCKDYEEMTGERVEDPLLDTSAFPDDMVLYNSENVYIWRDYRGILRYSSDCKLWPASDEEVWPNRFEEELITAENVPADTWYCILQYLSIRDIVALSATCTNLRKACIADRVWRPVVDKLRDLRYPLEFPSKGLYNSFLNTVCNACFKRLGQSGLSCNAAFERNTIHSSWLFALDTAVFKEGELVYMPSIERIVQFKNDDVSFGYELLHYKSKNKLKRFKRRKKFHYSFAGYVSSKERYLQHKLSWWVLFFDTCLDEMPETIPRTLNWKIWRIFKLTILECASIPLRVEHNYCGDELFVLILREKESDGVIQTYNWKKNKKGTWDLFDKKIDNTKAYPLYLLDYAIQYIKENHPDIKLGDCRATTY